MSRAGEIHIVCSSGAFALPPKVGEIVEVQDPPLVIVVDYDGVLDRAGYPNTGKIDEFVAACLGDLQAKGAYLVLNTCRTGAHLDAAVRLCGRSGLVFDAVNENLPHLVDRWGDCRKLGGDIYIDDKDLCFGRIRLYWRLWVLSRLYPHVNPWARR